MAIINFTGISYRGMIYTAEKPHDVVVKFDTFYKTSRAIAGRTARCCCKFRYVSNFTTTSCGFSATVRISCWSLSADCSELSVKK